MIFLFPRWDMLIPWRVVSFTVSLFPSPCFPRSMKPRKFWGTSSLSRKLPPWTSKVKDWKEQLGSKKNWWEYHGASWFWMQKKMTCLSMFDDVYNVFSHVFYFDSPAKTPTNTFFKKKHTHLLAPSKERSSLLQGTHFWYVRTWWVGTQ